MDIIVPFAVKRMAYDMTGFQFCVAHFSALLIRAFVEPRMDFQAGFRRRRADRLDHDLQRLQGNALPVPGDVAEQPMLNLVPFARAGRIVTDFDDQPRGIGDPLQLPSPEPGARTVAAAAVRGDQQASRSGKSFPVIELEEWTDDDQSLPRLFDELL